MKNKILFSAILVACISLNANASDLNIYSSNEAIKITNKTYANNLNTKPLAEGGALYFSGQNDAEISSSSFVNNTVQSNMFSLGGAIFSAAPKFSIIDTMFENNTAKGADDGTFGGAIFADASALIDSDFSINNVNFLNNSVLGTKNTIAGGAIASQYYKQINIDKTNFTGNFVNGNGDDSNANVVIGGAIGASKFLDPIGPNYGTKQNFTIDNSVFNNNYAIGSKKVYGGAIGGMNPDKTVRAISLDISNTQFTNNHLIGGTDTKGGAIATVYSYAPASNVQLDISNSVFDSNYIQDSSSAKGGAIYSQLSTINIENTDFVNNSIRNSSVAYGGAIYTLGSIVNIKNSNFIGNNVQGNSAFGGAIFYQGNGSSYLGILNIISDGKDVEFSDNTANGKSFSIYAGSNARMNLNIASGNKIIFNDNVTTSANNFVMNINDSSINSAAGGEFVINANMSSVQGEVNFNGGTITLGENGTLFTNVSKFTSNGGTIDLRNGKIQESKFNNLVLNNITDIKLDASLADSKTDSFNVKSANGGGALNITDIDLVSEMNDSVNHVESDFIKGAGSVNTTLDASLNTVLTQNSKYNISLNNNTLVFDKSAYSGGLAGAVAENGERQYQMANDEVVSDWNTSSTNVLQGNNLVVKGNSNSVIGLQNEGLVVNSSQNLVVNNVGNSDADNNITGSWNGFVSENGGAINNQGGTVNIKDSVFTDNTAENSGGAINNDNGTVNIVAAVNNVIFENNTANGESNAIHTNRGILNMNASGDKSIIFNDKITSENNTGTININAEKSSVSSVSDNSPTSGTVILNEDMSGYKGDVNLYHGTIKIGENGQFFDVKDFNIYGCTLDFANGKTQDTNLGNLSISDHVDIIVDADLASSKMDTISANNLITDEGKIHISSINLLSDAINDKTQIKFADDNLSNAVVYDGSDISYSPIFKYNVIYDKNSGNFDFNRFAFGAGSAGYNPAVLAAPIAAQIGSYLTQLNSYNMAFNNLDLYMLATREQRQALKLRNKFASTSGNITYSPLTTKYDSKGVWFKPYSTFENVPLKNGPTVNNVAYGSYFGGDSELKEMGHGWDGMFSLYAGYNGSHQTYSTNGIYQNGGVLGATGVAYKGNFFTALTANVGANSGEANTMYGTENFTMLTTGVASKTGYNWELAKGKFIIQPNFLMSYTFVNTFDYTNAAGIHINSDPLHGIQIAPGIRLIGNLKNGWQPYIGVSMVWNLIDKTRFQANDVYLPEMSIKPYISYGVGVQKTVGERFTGFLQAMINNGGRNGVSLSFGCRFALGKESKKSNALPQKQIVKVPPKLDLSYTR